MGERCCGVQPAQVAMIQHLAEGTFDIEQGLMPQSDSGEDGALSVLLLLLLVVTFVPCAWCPTRLQSLAEVTSDAEKAQR